MEVHPFFDINSCEWFVEIDDKCYVADTLRLLQKQLPDAQIKDYYPFGYVAIREGFLAHSNRVPFIKTHTPSRAKQKKINEYVRRDKEVQEAALETKPKAPEPPPQPPSYEAVMELTSSGVRTLQIAERLRVKLSDVQLLKIEGYRRKDPRIKPTYKRRSFRKYPIRDWTDEDQAELRHLAEQGLSAAKIGDKVNRSSNSIIGRCHRTGVQLKGPNPITARTELLLDAGWSRGSSGGS